jgi:hypothetical protein
MAVAAQNNVAQTFEKALQLAWIAQGIALADVFYNGFQINEESDRTFPQLQYGCGVDVPDGIEFDQESKTRIIDAAAAMIAHITDDPQRAALSVLFGKFRAMFAVANADRTTWASTYLPAGYSLDSLLIQISPPPFFDDNWAIFEVGFQIGFTLP